ncbi:MAG: translation initiation factor IF-2 subunit beta [Thermoplasmatota archaeon]
MPEDYSSLLKRARANVKVVGTLDRFVLPEPEIVYEGRTTIVKNFGAMLDKVNRSSDHAVPTLLREFSTAGAYDGGRLVLQGKVPEATIRERFSKYVDTYVTCGECGRPDTHLVREERALIVKCDACGGHRPVKGPKKQAPQKPADAVEEGKTYEVMIEDMGRRGDGIAHRENYTIFIEGAQKGQIYHVKINKVTGNLAFAEIVRPGTPP